MSSPTRHKKNLQQIKSYRFCITHIICVYIKYISSKWFVMWKRIVVGVRRNACLDFSWHLLVIAKKKKMKMEMSPLENRLFIWYDSIYISIPFFLVSIFMRGWFLWKSWVHEGKRKKIKENFHILFSRSDFHHVIMGLGC